MDRGPNSGQVGRAGVRTGHIPEIQQYDLQGVGTKSESVSGHAVPTDSLHELAEFRVGPQAPEGGLASQLDEIRVVFLKGSLQPLKRLLLVVDRPIHPCDVVR